MYLQGGRRGECRLQIEESVHQCLAHIFPWNDALLLVWEVFILVREQMEDLFDFVLFFGCDIVVFR